MNYYLTIKEVFVFNKMRKLHSNSNFVTALNKNGIDLDPPTIYDTLNLKTSKIPSEDSLIKIPNIETFPLEIPENNLIDFNIKEKFVESSYQLILKNLQKLIQKNISDNSNTLNFQEILPFDTSMEFVQFKRELQTYYQEISKENNFDINITVCKDPICLNSAVPTFEYCSYHLPTDDKFNSQPFLSQCDFIFNGSRCETPCSTKNQQCSLHKRSKKNKK